MFLFIVFAALFLPSGTVPGSSELLSKWVGWVNKIAQQSHLALFSSASSPPWDGEGLYFQLFAGCSGSDFIPAWGPLPLIFQLLQTGISLPTPSHRWLVDSVCGLYFPLLWWSSAQDAPCLSLFPYFQPYQFRFHQSQLPSTSTDASSTPVRTSIQCPWHSPCASTLTLYFPVTCLAVCSYG